MTNRDDMPKACGYVIWCLIAMLVGCVIALLGYSILD